MITHLDMHIIEQCNELTTGVKLQVFIDINLNVLIDN